MNDEQKEDIKFIDTVLLINIRVYLEHIKLLMMKN